MLYSWVIFKYVIYVIYSVVNCVHTVTQLVMSSHAIYMLTLYVVQCTMYNIMYDVQYNVRRTISLSWNSTNMKPKKLTNVFYVRTNTSLSSFLKIELDLLLIIVKINIF